MMGQLGEKENPTSMASGMTSGLTDEMNNGFVCQSGGLVSEPVFTYSEADEEKFTILLNDQVLDRDILDEYTDQYTEEYTLEKTKQN